MGGFFFARWGIAKNDIFEIMVVRRCPLVIHLRGNIPGSGLSEQPWI